MYIHIPNVCKCHLPVIIVILMFFHGNFFDSMIQHPEKKKNMGEHLQNEHSSKKCWFCPGIHHPTAPPRPSAKNTHVWCTSGLRTMKNSWCKKVGLVFMAWNHLVAPDMFQTNFLIRPVFFIRFTSLHPKKNKNMFFTVLLVPKNHLI